MFYLEEDFDSEVLFNAYIEFPDYSEIFEVSVGTNWDLDGVHYQDNFYAIDSENLFYRTDGFSENFRDVYLKFYVNPVETYSSTQTNDSVEIYRDLQDMIGVPIFEIPTMPPSITGLRIKEAFETQLPKKGVRLLLQKKVLKVHRNKDGFVLYIGGPDTEYTVKAKGIILASGRFLGRGLHADRKQIRESIFDLPVFQVGERTKWHRHNFLDPKGHLINMAGLEIDNMFRPLDSSGKPAFKTLFAAGSILAHQDWMRMKCGSGLAIASAYAAVKAFKE